ncbi:conserved hypothetical protein [Pediculus humanus corporis]|uniref:FYVE-type domain-containing protein n=1 Tax=Pediculus humanus subsp. corporis TaxID=121224 RepID=E0VRL9_PEDHC|nr:uncharacterized protein Phum_PHUM399910 [Pediculus humanus corporis]EEB16025.1 conserved hypothetical protein [Pediculus humanus corporis]
MSCYGCLTKFSFFTREHSCPNCGFSYCYKCLKEKVIIDEKHKNVCQNCYKKLNKSPDQMASTEAETPDLLLKRLEKLENPSKPPITIFRHSNRLMNLRSGLSSQDKEILERLEKLRAERTPPVLPDESEIKRRLALLQDKSEESIEDQKPQSATGGSSKTEEEQVNDLLKKYMDEAGLDADLETRGNKEFSEIESRLKKLNTSENTSTAHSPNHEPDDGDSITAKIIEKAIEEGKLEKRLQSTTESDSEDLDISDGNRSEEEPEFPWCIICNENATVKCFGCEGNLYCDGCFKQGHEFFNMEDHKFVPFPPEDPTS